MARTKSFQSLVRSLTKADPKFAEALLREEIDVMLSGDDETGKAIRQLSHGDHEVREAE